MSTSGGILQFENCNFTNYIYILEGGVFQVKATQLLINGGYIYNNIAVRGSVVHAGILSTITITNVNLHSNIASDQGGVLFIKENSEVNLQSNIFRNNTAESDAVFSILQDSVINDLNSLFENNIAQDKNSLGSIQSGQGKFIGSKVHRNHVTGTGGILIYSLLSSIDLSQCSLINNTVASGISNLYFINTNAVVNECTFFEPSDESRSNITRAGFITMIDSSLTLSHSKFTNGKGEKGGAIYIFTSMLNSVNNTIDSCVALEEGGAYYVSIISNIQSTNDTFINNRAIEGEAIFVKNNDNYSNFTQTKFISELPTQFIKGYFSSFIILQSEFVTQGNYDARKGDLKDGAAISIDSTVRIIVSDSLFQNMISDNGAFFLTQSQTGLTLNDIHPDLTNRSLVILNNNIFENSHSYGENGGAAVNYDCNSNQ